MKAVRIAAVAARVAQIQQDNLLDVHNFVEQRRIRIMEMEWIDGYDLSRLLAPARTSMPARVRVTSRYRPIAAARPTPMISRR